MRKRRNKQISVLVLCSMLISLLSSFNPAAAQEANTVPELFVSEIHPDVAGTDDYEFFEVYNNSNRTLRLNDYTFLYRYPSSNPDIPFVFAEASLAPQQTMVFWYNNTGKTAADFNGKYGVSLDSSQLIEVTGAGFTGFSNTADRTVVIHNKSGVEITKSGYAAATDIGAGLGDHYKVPASGTQTDKFLTKAAPTPGSLAPEQIPAMPHIFPDEPVSPAPSIVHTPITQGSIREDLTVNAQITDTDTVTAAVYYKNASDSVFLFVPMTAYGASAFTASVPKNALRDTQLQYYIEASDAVNVTRTDTYNVAIDQNTFDYTKVPVLLITELVPDSTNVNGASADAYEYVELYNNTTRPISLNDYKLIYRYTDSNKPDTDWLLPVNAVIPPLGTLVLWVMNGSNDGLNAADFNANYNTSLVEGTDMFRIDGGGGMANGGMRKIVVASKSGTEIAEAFYENDAQTVANKGITYKYPTNGSNAMSLYSAGVNAATPGTVEAELLPAQPAPAVNGLPAITHTPVASGSIDHDVVIEASIADPDNDIVTASVYYKIDGAPGYTAVPMTAIGGDQFVSSIPKAAFTGTTLQYYIEASDGRDTVKTNLQTVTIELGNVDFNKLSPLMVTELVPDSTNVGTADGYEFVEIYNNTDQTINFKNYKIYYRYTDSGPSADVVWPTDSEELLIPSRKTMVFWVINSQNKQKTVADFNQLYGTSLVEGVDIVKMYSDGMANGGGRGIVIGTNTKTEISAAYYDTDAETVANKGIFYKYSPAGSTTMIKYSAGLEAATPGRVEPAQVPLVTCTMPADSTKPTYGNLTNAESIDKSQNLHIVAEAHDENKVKSVALYYKSDRDAQYTKRYLEESFDDTNYHYTVYSPELIGRAYIEYYFVISDGSNEVETETYRVLVTGNADHSDLRLTLKDGDMLGGTTIVKATSEHAAASELKLSIDEKEVAGGTYAAVEHDAYFAFEANGVNYYFKNGVTIDSEILSIFEDPINSYTTLTVPIQADRLKAGSNIISIRAGTKASPFDDRAEENKDDFTVRNVRLVFADGTEIFDDRYQNRDTVINMGDSAGKFPVMDFNFVIPQSMLASKAYALDTSKLADGEHVVKVSHPSYGERTARITIDNTKPSVVTSVKDATTYRGRFVIDVTAEDALSGVAKIEAWLDETPIALPYPTTSSLLAAGEHMLRIRVADKVGNVENREVRFTVPEENPAKPELVAPASGASGVDRNAVLQVKVADPTSDVMNVSFYQGFKYDAMKQKDFQGFRGASDTEPPKVKLPGGEQAMTVEDYEQIATADGRYLTDDSVEKFPYQRFQVSLDAAVSEEDRIELSWKGKSLEGRKVSLYVWSPSNQEWTSVDSKIAGAVDFTLGAWITAGEYADNRMIQVMVQDELPVSQENYDFSFVWMSDTQYYSESYPHIYEDIVNWIKDNKDEKKIEYVIHTGDIVDEADKEIQWKRADADMKVLEDANIPYGVLAGNHDVDHQRGAYDYYWNYFGEDRFKNQPTYGGSLDNNRGHYDLISSNGNDFIAVYMGWGVRDSDIDWMNEVLAKYPNRKAILNFHEFLLVSGNRAPIADKIFEEVVKKNKNVFAVLSGHYHDAELLVDELDDNGDGVGDRKVYQMLADYQGAPEGGLGYIRLLQFDMANDKMYVKTYSPYLDDYNFYDPAEYPNKDEFAIDVDLKPQVKRVATDYVGVNVYTNRLIGKAVHVESGSTATAAWSNLNADTGYEWYAVAEDEYSGRSASDIWSFTTGSTGSTTDPGNGPSDPNSNPEQPLTSGNGKQVPVPTADGAAIAGEQESRTRADGSTLNVVKISADALAQAADMLKEKSGQTIQVTSDSAEHAARVELPAQALLNAAKAVPDLLIKVQAGDASYSLPLGAIDLARLSGSLGASVQDAVLVISIEPLTGASSQAVQNKAAQLGMTLIGSPVTFTVTVEAGGKSKEISDFGSTYVARTLHIGQQLDSSRTTAVMYDPASGELSFVPATFEVTGGRTVVTIKRNGNSIYAVGTLSRTFGDVANHWAKADIEWLASKLIVNGVSEEKFGPDLKVTRAEFSALVVRALGLSTGEDTAGFHDIGGGEWFAGAVGAAVKAGLVQGYADGSFKPDARITREELAVIIARALAFTGHKPNTAGDEAGRLAAFKDQAAISGWASAAVAQAAEAGIVRGTSGGSFAPDADATRAEAVVMLGRLLAYVHFMN